jgi:glycosyltransferase involved in cell wall biosynthesis
MKILVIAPTPFFSDRGTHIRILEEALALEKRGHQITIATYHIGREIPLELGSKIDVRRIRRWLFWYRKLEAGPDWQKIILDLLLIKKVFFLARTQKPDVIHAHLHEGVLIGWIVQKLLFWRTIKLVGDFHGSLTKEMVSHAYLKPSFLQNIFRTVEVWIDNLGDRAVTSSWNNTEEIQALRKKDTVVTLLDGTRLSMFDHLATKEELRREYGIPLDKTVVTYTGALIPNKGIKLFLDAIPEVAAKNEDIHFIIAGFPVDQITEYTEQALFQERATIISPLPYFDLPKILRMSDIGIDPKDDTVRQASGKTLQYMGAGLSIVVFDTENNREYLGVGGMYAKEVSAKGMAEAILTLAADKNMQTEKSRQNRLRAEEFSWEHTALVAEEIYQSLKK